MENYNKSQNELIQVGTLTGGIYDTSFDCIKRVYSTQGIAPTINTCGGGIENLKSLKIMSVIIEDFYKNRPIRYYADYCPTIRAERVGLKVLYISYIVDK